MCTGVRAVHQRKHSKGVVHLAIHDPLLKSFLRMHTRPMRRIIQARSVVCPADARSDADGIALRGCGWRRRSRALCCAGSVLVASSRRCWQSRYCCQLWCAWPQSYCCQPYFVAL